MSKENVDIKFELIPYDGFIGSKEFDFDKAIYDWLFNYDLETRKLIIDETFGLLEKSNIKRVSDISENYLKSLFEILKASKTLDNKSKVVIFNCLKLLSTTLSKTLINMELTKLKKKINFNK